MATPEECHRGAAGSRCAACAHSGRGCTHPQRSWKRLETCPDGKRALAEMWLRALDGNKPLDCKYLFLKPLFLQDFRSHWPHHTMDLGGGGRITWPTWHPTVTSLICKKPWGTDFLRYCFGYCKDMLVEKEYILDLYPVLPASEGTCEQVPSLTIRPSGLPRRPLWTACCHPRAHGGKAGWHSKLRHRTPGL